MVDKITSPIGANELIEKTNEIIDNLGAGVSALDDLSDVSITSAATGQLLQFDGTEWVNGTISSSDIETALGYTPYSSANPDGFISSASLTALTDVTISNAQDGQALVYDSTAGKWINSSSSGSPAWGSISGTLSDQTDLKNALDAKQSTSTAVTHTASSAVGSASRPVYIASNGAATTIGYTIETSVPAGAVFTDTKNSTGSSDSSAKLFVVGATAQETETQTFSNDAVFIDTSGQLNSTTPTVSEDSTVVATTKWVNDKGYGNVKSVNNAQPDANGNVTISIPDTSTLVTTGTAQNITGVKTFVGEKRIKFKQQYTSDKLGFTLYNGSGGELAGFELRPNTVSSASVLHLTAPNSQSTLLGFRYWNDSTSGKEIVIPKPSSNGIYYLPLSFKNDSTTVSTDSNGVADLSTLIPDVSGKQDTSNLVTSLSSGSTDTQYPSAKCVYNTIESIGTSVAANTSAIAENTTNIASNTSAIADITTLIPSAATSSNQLADKSFVNSSIATNTANFIGTFNSLTELNAYSGTKTNNDYAFVATTDTAGNTLYDRYKYVASTSTWTFEYELNNSSFTAAQWAAINSEITAASKVTRSGTVAVGSTIQPVYTNASGVVQAIAYTIAKSVPSDAKFTDTTYTVMTGATSSVAGASGLVPQPVAGDNAKFLRGDGTWAEAGSSYAMVVTDYTN